jgi:hypothetical protein
MQSRSRLRWVFIATVIAVALVGGGIWLARSLKPLQQQGLINRLPAFMQPVARSLILPVYPDSVPTPVARVDADVSSLLTPRATSTPTATQTPTPTPTPTQTPIHPSPTKTRIPDGSPVRPTLTPVIPPGPTQAARSTPAPLQSADVLLTGFRHIYQTWNNCGPATMSMNLSYYGWAGGQADAAQVLKPDPEDKNVSPHEMVAFAQSAGFDAIARTNGSLSTIKQFVRAGIPVLVEKGA